MDASTFLSAGAFVVSVASLYLTSLRRADLQVDHISQAREIGIRAWSGPTPTESEIAICLFVANTGAHGGLLQTLEARAVTTYDGSQPALWGESPLSLYPAHGTVREASLPAPFERDDNSTLFLRGGLGGSDRPWSGVEEFAERLRGLKSIGVTVTWSYRRPRFLWPGKRETKWASETFQIDATGYRQEAIDMWRQQPAYHHLIEIAEGRREAPQP